MSARVMERSDEPRGEIASDSRNDENVVPVIAPNNSSPSVRLVIRPPASGVLNEDLYRFKLVCQLKDFYNQKKSREIEINGDTHIEIRVRDISLLKQLIWDKFSHLIHGLALEEDEKKWTIDDSKKHFDFFEKYFFISTQNKVYTFKATSTSGNIITTSIMHNWTSKDTTVCLYIFPYGSNLETAKDFAYFEKSCLKPREADRSGAANEELHRQMIIRLKERWHGVYAAFDINWRIWATEILGKPVPTQETFVNQPPPLHLIHLFRHSPSNRDQQAHQFNRSMTMNLELLDAFADEIRPLKRSLNSLRTYLDDVSTRIDAIDEFIKKRRLTLAAVETSFNPIESPASMQFRRQILNQEDEDHQ